MRKTYCDLTGEQIKEQDAIYYLKLEKYDREKNVRLPAMKELEIGPNAAHKIRNELFKWFQE